MLNDLLPVLQDHSGKLTALAALLVGAARHGGYKMWQS
jgi:hypothetical protein